jgi:hypothetical protein
MSHSDTFRSGILKGIGLFALLFLFSGTGWAAPTITPDPANPANNSVWGSNSVPLRWNITGDSVNNITFTWNGTDYTILDSSLVLALNFNNNSNIGENATYAVDSSMYGNNFTFYNRTLICGNEASGQCAFWTNGKYGMGVNFGGDNASLRATDATIGNFTGTALTISAWVYPVELRQEQVVCKVTSYKLYFTSLGKPTFYVATNNAATSTGSSTGVALNSWYHLVGVYNGSKVMIYINGILNASATQTGNINSTTNKLYVSSYDGAAEEFNGTIDEVRIWDRALSSDEISMLYNADLAKHNNTAYTYFQNITGLSQGTEHNYSISANNSDGTTDSGTKKVYAVCGNPYTGINILQDFNLCSGSYALTTNANGIVISASNVVLRGNGTTITGNASGLGVYITGQNVTVRDLNVVNYTHTIDVHANYAQIDNNTLGFSNETAIFVALGYKYVNITSNRIENFTRYGIRDYGNYTLIKQNTIRYLSPTASDLRTIGKNPKGIYFQGANVTIYDNNISEVDRGITIFKSTASTWSCIDANITNNRIINTTLDSDAYNCGIHMYGNCSNILIDGNNISRFGSVGILLQLNITNVSIRNNYLDAYPILEVNQTLSEDYNEPPVAIFNAELYKRYISDGTENYADNVTKIGAGKSTGITLTNNTYGPNNQILLRTQGVSMTPDFTEYWYRAATFPTHLIEKDEFYINENVSTVYNNYYGINDTFWQGYGVTGQGQRNMIYYKLNVSSLFFQNKNDSITYNISLFSPKHPLVGLSGIVSSTQINHSLGPLSPWYVTATNFTPNAAPGEEYLINVTDKSENRTAFSIQNITGATQVNISDCGHVAGSSWVLNDTTTSGTNISYLSADSLGCVNWSIRSWSQHNETLSEMDIFISTPAGSADVYIYNSSGITIVGNGDISLAGYNVSSLTLGVNSSSSCDWAFRNGKITSENIASCLFNVTLERNRVVIVNSYRATGISRNIVWLLGALGLSAILVTIYRRRR